MKVLHIPYSDVEQFSQTDIAYAQQKDELVKFAKYTPALDQFARIIEDKSQEAIDREVVYEVLSEQYAQYVTDTSSALPLLKQLKDENCFTVITAHQPVLFTGPAYVAYKIISAIKLAQDLRSRYPEYQFVPLFITGGEDHDFEEMDHTQLYGKTIQWVNEETGPVGRMSTESLVPALEALREILGDSPTAQKVYDIFLKTHTQHKTYSVAFADLINALFGELGIIVANMDDPRFKEKMKDIFRDELLNHHSSEYVRSTQKEIEAAGFSPQAYAREINLFYLDKGLRNRIEKENGAYKIVDTDRQFTEEEMLDTLEHHPEKFSPNVVIRPLYQERIFPNLAYIGGGGELAYWLERKSQFEFFGINFPMLVRRDSCLWIDRGSVKKMQKLDLPVTDFFQPAVEQIKAFVQKNAEHEFSLSAEKNQLEEIWNQIAQKAETIDPTLKGAAAAEGKNQIKAMEKIEDRLRRTEKQKHEVALGQIESIRSKLYPDGGLQERVVNFLEFYLRTPKEYFDILFQAFDPLDMRLKVLVDE